MNKNWFVFYEGEAIMGPMSNVDCHEAARIISGMRIGKTEVKQLTEKGAYSNA